MTASEILDAVRSELGLHFTLEGRCAGGEVGAYFARRDSGERVVFKWFEPPSSADELRAAVHRVERLRLSGYPAARHEIVEVSAAVLVVQEAVAGKWRDEVDDALLDTVLELNNRQAAQGSGADGWSAFIATTLTEGADGWCIHDTLRKYSAETSRLLRRIQEIGAGVVTLPTGDVVHVDFHHRNMLRTGDRLTAIIDWEGCKDGDRVFDLVTFAFGLPVATRDPQVDRRLREHLLRVADRDALAAYVAHMGLRRIDWTIRYHDGVEVAVLAALTDDYLWALG